MIATIAAPGTNKLYVLYDTQIKTVAAAAKFTINSGKKSNLTENLVTGTSIVDKARTKEVKQALAQYGYILEESGLSIEDVLGYVVELTVENQLQVGETTESSMEADAVTSISSKETPAESGITGTVEEDTSPPKLQSIAITSTTEAQSIELLFDKTITALAQDKIIVQEGNDFFRIATATNSKTNSKELQITLADFLKAGATIKVTLEAGAVQDIAGNSNEVDSTGKTGTVGSQAPTDTTAPTMTGISANDSSNTTVIVEFNEAVKNIDKDKFAVSNNGVQQIIDKAKVETGTDGNKVTLTLATAFTVGDKIEVTLEEGAVADTANNQNVIDSTGKTATVSDVIAPTISKVSANDGADKTVIVEFSEVVKNPDITKFKASKNGAQQTIDNAVAGADANKITLTLAEAFKVDDTITVTLEAGAVTDTANHQNVIDSTGITATVVDGIAPTISKVSANDSSNTIVIVEFSEAVKNIDKDKFVVSNNGVQQIIDKAEVGTGTDAKKVTLTLKGAFSKGNKIAVTLEVSAVVDNAGNANTKVSSTTTVLDTSKPILQDIRATTANTKVVVVGYNEAVKTQMRLRLR